MVPSLGIPYGGYGSAAVVPPPTDYVLDHFTDADNTLLIAHTPDIGGPWSNLQGTFKILSNQLVPNTDVDGDAVSIDAGHSDYTITASVNVMYAVGATHALNLLFRVLDNNNYWLLQAQDRAGVQSLVLWEQLAGVFTMRAVSAVGISGLHTAKCVLLGANVDCYWDNVLQFSFAMGSGAGRTKVGVRNVNFGVVAGTPTMDDFDVTP